MPSLSPDFVSPDSGADLVAIRHTVLRPANESVLAVCLSHTLMDGDALSRMAQHLSFLYENPGAKLARPPAFLARPLWKSWPPSDQVIKANKLNLGCVVDTLPEQLELGAKILSSCEPMTVSLSAADLRHLKGRYAAEGGSSTDAVCGWLIVLLERVGEVDNPKIFTIVNVSGIPCAAHLRLDGLRTLTSSIATGTRTRASSHRVSSTSTTRSLPSWRSQTASSLSSSVPSRSRRCSESALIDAEPTLNVLRTRSSSARTVCDPSPSLASFWCSKWHLIRQSSTPAPGESKHVWDCVTAAL